MALPADVPVFDHLGTLVGTVAAGERARATTGAEVRLASDPRAARADSTGGFVIFAGRGTHAVSVRAPGYRPLDTVVTLEAERVDTLRVALRPLSCAPGGP